MGFKKSVREIRIKISTDRSPIFLSIQKNPLTKVKKLPYII